MRKAALAPALLGLALAAGCGGGAAAPDAPRGVAALDARARPPLLRAPVRPGEVVLRAGASPRIHGPVRLDGAYTVRFEQYAPEDPRMDFAGQTSFVADLERREGVPAVRLFRAAAATGRRTVRLRGRYFVDVRFGDFPYVVRFTPRRG